MIWKKLFKVAKHSKRAHAGQTRGLSSISEVYGLEAAHLVEAVTYREDESLKVYYERVKVAGAAAMILMRADRQHNYSESHLLTPEKAEKREKALKNTEMMEKVFIRA